MNNEKVDLLIRAIASGNPFAGVGLDEDIARNMYLQFVGAFALDAIHELRRLTNLDAMKN